MGWLEKPSLPVIRGVRCLVCTPMELNAVIDFGDLHTVEHPEEIEMPPGSAKLAVGRDLQADVFLLLDDLLDLAVLDLLELLPR